MQLSNSFTAVNSSSTPPTMKVSLPEVAAPTPEPIRKSEGVTYLCHTYWIFLRVYKLYSNDILSQVKVLVFRYKFSINITTEPLNHAITV